MSCLTGTRYKIYSKDRGKTYELYDLIDDPGERRNLADERSEILARMRETLEGWRASCTASRAGTDYPRRSRM